MKQILFRTLYFVIPGVVAWHMLGQGAAGEPSLVSPAIGTLELVTASLSQQLLLDRIDGLTFDVFGNLIGTIEIEGESGGVVYVEKSTGAVTVLVTGISRADQVAFDSSGKLFLTSEVYPESADNRLWHVTIAYDALHKPISASKSSIHTSLAINGPEGLVVLDATSAYGAAGELLVAEDVFDGRILRISPDGTATPLAMNLQRPEGLAFGSFTGMDASELYVAETATDRVLRIGSNGTSLTVGSPGLVSLDAPDNLEFSSDGYLYVSEDLPGTASRVIRIDPQGDHEVFAIGFDRAEGLAFDPANGDLYIAEQGLDRVWRVAFATSLPGDYNRDGTVDAADYVVWRKGLGAAYTPAHFDLWRAHFGQTAGNSSRSSVAVPEPVAVVLLFIAFGATPPRRRAGLVAASLTSLLRKN